MKNVSLILIGGISLSGLSLSSLTYSKDKAIKNVIDKESSWGKIINSPTYVIEDKKINFSGTMVHVLDTCMLDDDTIRSSKEIAHYQWSDQVDDNNPKLVKGFLTTKKATSKTYSDYDTTIEQEEVRNVEYMLSVFFRDAHESATPAFVKPYTIPSC